MEPALTALLDLLRLETIDTTVFRGASQDLGWGRVFGGQVLGQALSAAETTVTRERQVHSIHAYFLRPGDASRPIEYRVDPIRDGRSFSTRRVVAHQGERAIFNLSASFQRAETSFDHADEAPSSVPPPEELLSHSELAREWTAGLPEALQKSATAKRPIEIRPVDPSDPRSPTPGPPRHRAWLKAVSQLPSDPRLHTQLLSYASDFHFLTASLRPYGVSWLTPGIQVASLDHAMWFHRPFRVDDWLLYDVESPSASGSRGLARGRFFDRAGRLVASSVQEGLIRDRRESA